MTRITRRFFMTAAVGFAVLATQLPIPHVAATANAQAYGGSGGSIAERAVNDFSSRLGISRGAAAGLVGNFAHETGNFAHYNEIRPLVEGSRGGAGWAQWTASRRVDFENFSNSRGLASNSYEANLEFAIHELTTSYSGSVLSRLRDPNISPTEAAYIVRRYYESPYQSGAGVHNSDASRNGYANAYANGDFSGTPGTGAYDGTGGVGGGMYAGFGAGTGEAVPEMPAVQLMPWGTDRMVGAYPQGTL